MVMDEKPDWDREKPKRFWDPGQRLLKSIRDYQKLNSKNPLFFFIKKICVLRYRFWSVVSGADIPLQCKIGGGLLIPHPNGIVIYSLAEIGTNCLILQQVTVGGCVRIGSHVDIGAGAKIISKHIDRDVTDKACDQDFLNIGNNVKIGANAVVLSDIPCNCTAIGMPARIIKND